MSQVKELQKKLDQEMTVLRKRCAELENISHALGHRHYLNELR